MSRINEGNNTPSPTDQLKDTAQQVGENLRSLGSQARDAATGKINDLKQQATDQYNNVRQQATEYYGQGVDKAQEWEHGIEQYVQEKPIQSLLIAAGVGVVLGMIWKRS